MAVSSADPVPRISTLARPFLLSDRELEGLVTTARSEYNVGDGGRLDKRDGQVEPCDFGDIGEDASGVWVRRAPEAMLLDFPRLWGAVEHYRLGCMPFEPMSGCVHLRPDDADQLDALTHCALMVIAEAHNRIRMGATK